MLMTSALRDTNFPMLDKAFVFFKHITKLVEEWVGKESSVCTFLCSHQPTYNKYKNILKNEEDVGLGVVLKI